MLAVALVPIFAWGADSVGGGYRVRSEVNSGGEFFQKVPDGGPYTLHGSVGEIGSAIASSPNNKIQAGAQASFYFPKPITTLTAVPLSSDSVTLWWYSVGGGTEYNQPVGSYDVRYKEGGGLTQANFHGAAQMASPPSPSGYIDNSEPTVIPGLKYDTLYDVGIVSLDKDSLKNEAFLGPTVSTYTLAPLPFITSEPIVSPRFKRIIFKYSVENPDNKSLDFELEISTVSNFSHLYAPAIKDPPKAENLRGENQTQTFKNLAPNIYFIRVRSMNQVKSPSQFVKSNPITLGAVSYTHLDVYKRQFLC